MTKQQRYDIFAMILLLGILIVSRSELVKQSALLALIVLGFMFIFFAKGENE